MSSAVIEVLWRPGCPFCARLRGELARAGVATTERDIWCGDDPSLLGAGGGGLPPAAGQRG